MVHCGSRNQKNAFTHTKLSLYSVIQCIYNVCMAMHIQGVAMYIQVMHGIEVLSIHSVEHYSM